jgi:hypothetical protein
MGPESRYRRQVMASRGSLAHFQKCLLRNADFRLCTGVASVLFRRPPQRRVSTSFCPAIPGWGLFSGHCPYPHHFHTRPLLGLLQPVGGQGSIERDVIAAMISLCII